MVVKNIFYHPDFVFYLKKLHQLDQQHAIKAENLFRANPLHPLLRLYMLKGRLKGLHTISVTLNIRILFKRKENGDIVFLSIGRHDIYRSL